MSTAKKWRTVQPAHPGSKLDPQKLAELFRDMRIERETGISPDPAKWRSIRDVLTAEALAMLPDDEEAA